MVETSSGGWAAASVNSCSSRALAQACASKPKTSQSSTPAHRLIDLLVQHAERHLRQIGLGQLGVGGALSLQGVVEAIQVGRKSGR
ncbi:MAG: hypothetical protein WDM85_14910 [Caulobacteraceae bacterium]